MEIRIYFCAILYNEDSEIIQISDIKKQDTQSGSTNVAPHIQDSKTTLSILYKDGWRLIQATLSPDTNGYRLFLERG